MFFSNKKCLFISSKDEKSIFDIVVFNFDLKDRINISSEILCKKIVIIGLGSVGSRVAVDLARAGFNNLYLIDDDVFLPVNIVRHELSARSYGEFKVLAIKKYINSFIDESIHVDTGILCPNGQESSSTTNRFLKACEDSSLIIDCTSCDTIFFTLNKVVLDKDIPFISGTVIPGGLGNIILVRKRNDIDLESLLASFYTWCDNKKIFAKKINDYSCSFDEQTFNATMSDCSILSGLIGRISIDFLSNKLNGIENINVFSTSSFCDLGEMYKTFKVKGNQVQKESTCYKEADLRTGRKIYEDYCSKRNI